MVDATLILGFVVPATCASERSRRRRVILIVDDNDDAREMYAAYFYHLDFDVATAPDGAEALRLAAELKPDVVVMDLTMPVMDGWTATRRLKAHEELRVIPVVAVSGHATGPAAAQSVSEAGFDRFVLKPCLPEDLADVVRELLT